MDSPPPPVPSSLFDNNNDDIFNFAQKGGSPGSKRCPTFKDYADKVKQLQQENFQLRVRIFLSEQKSGVKTSSSDFSVLFPNHTQHQIQQHLHNLNPNTHSVASLPNFDALSAQLASMKSQNEQMTTKVSELENRIHNYDVMLREKQRDNDKLMLRNQDLLTQVEEMQTKFALSKINIRQQQQQHQETEWTSDDELERGARIAFGLDDLEEVNNELESKLIEKSEKVEHLELQLQSALSQLDIARSECKKLIQDKDLSDAKIVDLTKVLRGLGDRVGHLTMENESFKAIKLEYETEIGELQKQKAVPPVVFMVQKKSSPRGEECVLTLEKEKRVLKERLMVSEAALVSLHKEHAKLVGELKYLRNVHHQQCPILPEKLVNTEESRPSDSTSPDLGIDSGHDGATNSDDSHSNNFRAKNRVLRNANRELALKLQKTRQALEMTLEKLHSITKQKEQVEKTICRQLHKSHTILRNAKKSLEKSAAAQCQENIAP